MENLKKIHPKLSEAILELLVKRNPDYKFYGQFFLHLNIQPSTRLKTAGVYAKGTKLYMDYNHKFIDNLTIKEVKWLLGHEIKHLLYAHINRTKASGYDHKKSNIVQDMIINSILKEDFSADIMTAISGEYGEGEDKVTIPKLLVPPEYKGERMYEPLYRWMEKIEDEMKKEDKKGDNPDGSKGGDNPDDSEEMKTAKDMLRNSENGEGFDAHSEDEMSDLEKEVVKDVIEGIRARGFSNSTFENVLDKLKVSKKDNLKYIKQEISAVAGTTPHKSFLRANRYGIKGAKGRVYKSCEINAILDVSGSMSGGLIEKALSNINQSNITINLILADTQVNKVYKVTNKQELQKIKIVGYGGTVLQPAVDYIINDNGLKKNNTIILTDGYCDSLDLNGLKGRTLIVTTDVKVKYVGSRVKQVVMEQGDLK